MKSTERLLIELMIDAYDDDQANKPMAKRLCTVESVIRKMKQHSDRMGWNKESTK